MDVNSIPIGALALVLAMFCIGWAAGLAAGVAMNKLHRHLVQKNRNEGD